jgi:cytochrome c oxidase subunit 1
MHIIGVGGHMRRIYDPTQYEFLQPLQHWNVLITYGALILGFSQLIFIANFFWSMFAGKVAGKNPWHANTLEWEAPSPPGHGNFPGPLPTVYRGPYEYSSPLVPEDYLRRRGVSTVRPRRRPALSACRSAAPPDSTGSPS